MTIAPIPPLSSPILPTAVMSSYTPLQLIPPLPPAPYDPVPIPTTLAFDPYADLVNIGTSAGTVVSYSSPLSLTRHVTYPAHGAKSFSNFMGFEVGEVREMMMTEREVWSLTPGGAGGRTRGGMARWSATWVADRERRRRHPPY